MEDLPCEHVRADIIYKQWSLLYARKYPHFTIDCALKQIQADDDWVDEHKTLSFPQLKSVYKEANQEFYELTTEWIGMMTRSVGKQGLWVQFPYKGPQYCKLCLCAHIKDAIAAIKKVVEETYHTDWKIFSLHLGKVKHSHHLAKVPTEIQQHLLDLYKQLKEAKKGK